MFNYIIALILTISFYILYQKFTRRKLPPGPIPWPFIGNLIELARVGGNPYEGLFKMSKKYGNIFSLTVGIVPTVVICGNEAVRMVLKSEDYDNRPDQEWVIDRSYGKQIGLIFSPQPYWKEVRRLTTRILKEFGFGKIGAMEGLILDEFDEFIKRLKTKIAMDDTILIDCLFNGPYANVIWSLVTGSRFDPDDPEFHKLLTGVNEFQRTGQLGGTNLLGAYPFLVKYFPKYTGFTELHRLTVFVRSYFERLVKNHRDRGTYKTYTSNLVDAFLLEIDNNQNSPSEIYTDENLVCIVNDLFLAGAETSANSTAMAIRLMVQYPEVQKKVQTEIDHVIRKSRMVNYTDKPLLRYADATVLEVLRYTSVAPFGPRRADKTYKLGPYEIPKGTSVLVNLYSAQMEESVWGDPQNFRPERFLNENGDIVNSEKLAAFGFGKRNCIAEVTARTTLFIGFCNLVQNFNFLVDPKSGVPPTDDLPGFTTAPKPFTIRIKTR